MSRPDDPVLDRKADRRVVAIGAVATIAFTGFFLLLPSLVPLEHVRRIYLNLTGERLFGNPFLPLRFAGGPVAGFLTAYLTDRRWLHRVTNALKAIVYGTVGLYFLFVFYSLAKSALGGGTVPLLRMILFPLIVGLPIGLTSVVGGFFGALFGHLFRLFRHDPATPVE
jgi:hypothetical protein